MKHLSAVLLRNRNYFLGYLIFLLALFLFCAFYGKSVSFLEINSFHTRPLDYFFILLTYVGNGLFAIALIIWMALKRKYTWAWQTGISFLISGAIVQILKHMIYSPRPKVYFAHRSLIHIIPGVTLTGSSSFPSGHAATIFALCTLLSFYFPVKRWGILLLVIACLTGFSRIYLSQHFPVDILVGSLIGLSVSVFTFMTLTHHPFANRTQELPPQSVKLR